MNVMTRLSAPAGPARFTAAEFLRMDEAGVFGEIRLELIRGELQRMPPPGNDHSALQTSVLAQLLALRAVELIRVEIGIDLGNDTIVGADVAMLSAGVGRAGPLRPADVGLIVEVAVSTRDRDLEMKRRLYAAAGIPTYWVVDAERRLIHVFDRPERDDYMGLSLVRFGEPLAVPNSEGTIVLD